MANQTKSKFVPVIVFVVVNDAIKSMIKALLSDQYEVEMYGRDHSGDKFPCYFVADWRNSLGQEEFRDQIGSAEFFFTGDKSDIPKTTLAKVFKPAEIAEMAESLLSEIEVITEKFGDYECATDGCGSVTVGSQPFSAEEAEKVVALVKSAKPKKPTQKQIDEDDCKLDEAPYVIYKNFEELNEGE